MNFIVSNQKAVAGLLLFLVWLILVFLGYAPASDLVKAIQDSIFALFGFHAVTNFKGKDQ